MHESLAFCHVHVWYRLTDALDDLEIAESLACLSSDERARYEKQSLPQDRRDFVIAHALLRSSLSRYGHAEPHEWAFVTSSHGRPALRPMPGTTPLSFSLSHTRGCVACAIAPVTDIGIDVERTDLAFDFDEVASRYFDAGERAQLERTPDAERAARFVELWTLKEARGKATGRGLSDAEHEPMAWQFALFDIAPHFRLGVAVASDRQPWTITARNLDCEDVTRGHCPV
jgi:4'-phosphopantetheinyl transferase